MQPHVLVVGESLVDIVTHADGTTAEHPGGSAANVAVALARLEREVRFVTAWADDAHGALLADHLARAGVELAVDPLVLARTATAHATLDEAGSASYEFDLDWRLGPLPGASAEQVAHLVHVCSLGAVVAPGADAVLELVARSAELGAVVLYDVNARPSITGTGPDVRARVEAMVALAHVVKASDEDLTALYPLLSARAAVDHLLGLGPRAVVLTRGGEGLSWHEVDAEPVVVPADEARLVDTIGAGDTVSAALLDAMWDALDRGSLLDLEPCFALRRAARAAAVTVSRPGADPPYRREL